MPAKAPRAPVTLTASSGKILRRSVSLGLLIEHAKTKSNPVRARIGPRGRELADGLFKDTTVVAANFFAFRIDFENGDRATGLTYDWRAIIDWLAKGARRKNGLFRGVVLDPSTPAEMAERYLDRRGSVELGEKA